MLKLWHVLRLFVYVFGDHKYKQWLTCVVGSWICGNMCKTSYKALAALLVQYIPVQLAETYNQLSVK